MDLSGSTPTANTAAIISFLASSSALAFCGSVNACHPTMLKSNSSPGVADLCRWTQVESAPR